MSNGNQMHSRTVLRTPKMYMGTLGCKGKIPPKTLNFKCNSFPLQPGAAIYIFGILRVHAVLLWIWLPLDVVGLLTLTFVQAGRERIMILFGIHKDSRPPGSNGTRIEWRFHDFAMNDLHGIFVSTRDAWLALPKKQISIYKTVEIDVMPPQVQGIFLMDGFL